MQGTINAIRILQRQTGRLPERLEELMGPNCGAACIREEPRDYWRTPIEFTRTERAIVLRSYGPNKRREETGGDDIVVIVEETGERDVPGK